MSRSSLLIAILAIAATAGCAGDLQRVRGIVVDVRGDLGGVKEFTVVAEDGAQITFVPDDGLHSFEHGAPLSHLSEHLQTADPIRVTYAPDDGFARAVLVEDAG